LKPRNCNWTGQIEAHLKIEKKRIKIMYVVTRRNAGRYGMKKVYYPP